MLKITWECLFVGRQYRTQIPGVDCKDIHICFRKTQGESHEWIMRWNNETWCLGVDLFKAKQMAVGIIMDSFHKVVQQFHNAEVLID